MNEETLIHHLAIALAIGLLVGAERHWRERDASPGSRAAGLRTFGLVGLSGGIMGALAGPAGPIGGALVIGAGLVALVAVLLPFALREADADHDVSATSLVAAVVTYALGALAVAGEGQIQAAGAAAVAMTGLLAAREKLHGLVERITWAEMRSAILLLSMTLVALPLVPDEPLSWLPAINLHKIWTLAILLASISFLGYLAVKLGGAERGLLLAGAAGGLVSSTATTLSNASASADGGPARGLAAGALVAGAVSCLRTIGLAFIAAPAVGLAVLPALLAAALGFGVMAAVLALRGTKAEEEPKPPSNPFELWSVIRMALLLGGVSVVAKLGAEWLGGAAVLLIAAVTGLADVDAITLSVPGLVPTVIDATLAAAAIAVAVASNITAKAVYAATIGTREYAWSYGLGSVIALAAGGAALLATMQSFGSNG